MSDNALLSLLCTLIFKSKPAPEVRAVLPQVLSVQLGNKIDRFSLPGVQPGRPICSPANDSGTAGGAGSRLPAPAMPAPAATAPPEPVAAPARVSLSGLVQIVAPPVLAYSNIPDQYLDATQPVDRVAALISSNEGTPQSIDWDDNGHGISVGLFQANQRLGELPDLLHELALAPGGQGELTAALGPTVTSELLTTPEVARRWNFLPGNALGRGLKKLVSSRLFVKVQVVALRRKVVKAAELASDYGITSTAGVAVCADLANQWGQSGARRFLQAAHSMRSQGGKVKAVVNAVCCSSPYKSRYLSDLEKLRPDCLSFNDSFNSDYLPSTPHHN